MRRCEGWKSGGDSTTDKLVVCMCVCVFGVCMCVCLCVPDVFSCWWGSRVQLQLPSHLVDVDDRWCVRPRPPPEQSGSIGKAFSVVLWKDPLAVNHSSRARESTNRPRPQQRGKNIPLPPWLFSLLANNRTMPWSLCEVERTTTSVKDTETRFNKPLNRTNWPLRSQDKGQTVANSARQTVGVGANSVMQPVFDLSC